MFQFSRRAFSTTARNLKSLLEVPKPTKEIPDVDTFLKKIGRECSEHSEIFKNDWAKFFTMGSKQMKEEGIDTAVRRYILDWQEGFRQGQPLYEVKTLVKKHGGERRRKIYAADKKVKEKIRMAQLRKSYKKAATAERIQTRKWEKMHMDAEH